jgi:DNA-binding PadR family transcriptional regulator
MYDEESISLSPSEAFVLSMVKYGGLSSLYQFHQLAGLSHGAIFPILRRLQELHLLESAFVNKGKRTRTYRVTADGESQLEVDWRAGWGKSPPDSESVVRTAWVLSLFDPEHANEYLLHIAKIRLLGAEKIRVQSWRGQRTLATTPLERFRYMQDSMMAALLKAQAEVCTTLAANFNHLKAERKTTGVKPPKEKK